MQEAYSYHAYGLSIQSALALPELAGGEGPADVSVRFGSLNAYLPGALQGERTVFADANEVFLYWPWAGGYLIRNGSEIILDPLPGLDERVIRLFLLGAGFATLLHQRGLLTLHASVVRSSDGAAIAFLGWKGRGKSTMAGAMERHGWSLVADDVSPIRFDAACPVVIPGFPQLKLWPDSAVSLGEDIDSLPLLHPQLEKRARVTDGLFSLAPVPLCRIYSLAEGSAIEIAPLAPQEAFKELMRHSYANHFLYQNKLLKGTETSARHLTQCSALIAAVPVAHLSRPLSLSALPDVVRAVEADLA